LQADQAKPTNPGDPMRGCYQKNSVRAL